MTEITKNFCKSKLDDDEKEEGVAGGIKKTRKSFEMLDEVCLDHSFVQTVFKPVDSTSFNKAMQSERKMMENDLPEGIYVKFYENRLDLCTAMIETPYASCLFFFDVKFSKDYPNTPPEVKYISYSTERLHTCIDFDGSICLSLLNTSPGLREEMWLPNRSTLLQLFVSIQGLILVPQPLHFDEPIDAHNGQYLTISENYNEDIVALVIETMTNQISKPPNCFRDEVLDYYRSRGLEIHNQLQTILRDTSNAPFPLPKHPDWRNFNGLLQEFKDAVVELRFKSKIFISIKKILYLFLCNTYKKKI